MSTDDKPVPLPDNKTEDSVKYHKEKLEKGCYTYIKKIVGIADKFNESGIPVWFLDAIQSIKDDEFIDKSYPAYGVMQYVQDGYLYDAIAGYMDGVEGLYTSENFKIEGSDVKVKDMNKFVETVREYVKKGKAGATADSFQGVMKNRRFMTTGSGETLLLTIWYLRHQGFSKPSDVTDETYHAFCVAVHDAWAFANLYNLQIHVMPRNDELILYATPKGKSSPTGDPQTEWRIGFTDMLDLADGKKITDIVKAATEDPKYTVSYNGGKAKPIRYFQSYKFSEDIVFNIEARHILNMLEFDDLFSLKNAAIDPVMGMGVLIHIEKLFSSNATTVNHNKKFDAVFPVGARAAVTTAPGADPAGTGADPAATGAVTGDDPALTATGEPAATGANPALTATGDPAAEEPAAEEPAAEKPAALTATEATGGKPKRIVKKKVTRIVKKRVPRAAAKNK